MTFVGLWRNLRDLHLQLNWRVIETSQVYKTIRSPPDNFRDRGNENIFSMRKLKNSELDRLSVDEFKRTEKTPIIIVLDNIRSLNNIGSVFRTSDAFLVEKIYLCGITATPPHKDIHKTALGSTETVDWEYIENTLDVIQKLKSENVIVASVEQAEHSVMLNDFAPQPQTTYALVFGNEVKGVAQNVVSASDLILEIPQFGTKHSLNISVSCGLVVWDVFSKMGIRKV
jgi:tRNA G18 (ribose-2'-O)-methylase SpoU